MNCNKPKRFNYGSLVPGAIGLQDYGNLGEADEYAAILAQKSGQIPAAPTQQPQQRRGMDWQKFAQAAGLGAMAGFGGSKGVAMAPILAMLMQLPQFKQMLSGRTPGFNPNAK